MRRAALVVAGGLLPALAGCGAAPAADGTAAAWTALPLIAPEPTRRSVPAASRAAARPPFGDRVTSVAAKFAGAPYVWGGTTPRGFDCSGFTRYVYAKLGKQLPRVSHDQFRSARKVGRQVGKGDLVFFHTRSGRVYHVGIYAGGGRIWHAPNPGKPVLLGKISAKRWSAGRY